MGGSQWINTFWADARQTVAPPRRGKDGLLAPLLVALTAVTGLVDAFRPSVAVLAGHPGVVMALGARRVRPRWVRPSGGRPARARPR